MHVLRADLRDHKKLGTSLKRVIRRSGLEAWPKIGTNLRSTRETELLNDGHKAHVVGSWIGNTLRVAVQHYAQVTEDLGGSGCCKKRCGRDTHGSADNRSERR